MVSSKMPYKLASQKQEEYFAIVFQNQNKRLVVVLPQNDQTK